MRKPRSQATRERSKAPSVSGQRILVLSIQAYICRNRCMRCFERSPLRSTSKFMTSYWRA
jgi:hypothetical protein